MDLDRSESDPMGRDPSGPGGRGLRADRGQDGQLWSRDGEEMRVEQQEDLRLPRIEHGVQRSELHLWVQLDNVHKLLQVLQVLRRAEVSSEGWVGGGEPGEHLPPAHRRHHPPLCQAGTGLLQQHVPFRGGGR